jgi:hypothetical protein
VEPIAREMGAPPQLKYKFFGGDEGACEAFIYPSVANLRHAPSTASP